MQEKETDLENKPRHSEAIALHIPLRQTFESNN